ncbi:MAG: hypothetical protein RIT35_1457 [Pseudomonadota bacterium]|jgi:hypothetical protein
MVIDDEDFDINSTDYETIFYEAEIIQIWDSLPDYCKTLDLWNKIKEMANPSLLCKLSLRD